MHEERVEIKDLERTKLCLQLQIEYLKDRILVYQDLSMDQSHPSCIPIVVKSLEMDKDPFIPQETDREMLGLEVPYL